MPPTWKSVFIFGYPAETLTASCRGDGLRGHSWLRLFFCARASRAHQRRQVLLSVPSTLGPVLAEGRRAEKGDAQIIHDSTRQHRHLRSALKQTPASRFTHAPTPASSGFPRTVNLQLHPSTAPPKLTRGAQIQTPNTSLHAGQTLWPNPSPQLALPMCVSPILKPCVPLADMSI
jgi:hypothetical protein